MKPRWPTQKQALLPSQASIRRNDSSSVAVKVLSHECSQAANLDLRLLRDQPRGMKIFLLSRTLYSLELRFEIIGAGPRESRDDIYLSYDVHRHLFRPPASREVLSLVRAAEKVMVSDLLATVSN